MPAGLSTKNPFFLCLTAPINAWRWSDPADSRPEADVIGFQPVRLFSACRPRADGRAHLHTSSYVDPSISVGSAAPQIRRRPRLAALRIDFRNEHPFAQRRQRPLGGGRAAVILRTA